MFNGHRRESGNKIKQLQGGRTFICGTQLTRRFSDISARLSGTHSWNVTTLISTAQMPSQNQELCRLASWSANCGKFPEVWGQCGKGFKIKLCYELSSQLSLTLTHACIWTARSHTQLSHYKDTDIGNSEAIIPQCPQSLTSSAYYPFSKSEGISPA